MDVSIVLVAYNRGHVIERTLSCIQHQTYQNFECLIMDDCSTDNTEKICRDFVATDVRFKYYKQPYNKRMPENLNDGIKLAQGKFIANLHDGDFYRPDLIEKWRDCLVRNPNAAFVFNAYHGLDEFDQPSVLYLEDLPESFSGTKLIEKYYFRRWSFSSPVWGTVMMRKDALEHCGLFDPQYSFYSDIEMWIRLGMKYDVCYVAEPLISLPNRKNVPRLFNDELWQTEWLVQKIWLDCRKQYYSQRPLRKVLEIGRHWMFRIMKGIYWGVVKVKNEHQLPVTHVAKYMLGLPHD